MDKRCKNSALASDYRCNQSCVHCHVNAGPNRKEEMTGETIDAVIDFLAASPEITAIDLNRPHLEENKPEPCPGTFLE